MYLQQQLQHEIKYIKFWNEIGVINLADFV